MMDSASFAGRCILVVDADRGNRPTIQEYLRRWGAATLSAEESSGAIRVLEASVTDGARIDAVLLGEASTAETGIDLVRKIRCDPRFARIAILVLSRAGAPEVDGPIRHLRPGEPIDPVMLHDALSGLLTVRLAAEGETRGPDGDAVASGVRLRILVAEDQRVNQVVAMRLLGGMGHEVVIAGDGREALELWERGHFDLILMDVQMPEMDGFEALAAIRSRELCSSSRTRIVAVTAQAMDGDRERCLAAGFDDYLPKPMRRENLKEALRTPGPSGPT